MRLNLTVHIVSLMGKVKNYTVETVLHYGKVRNVVWYITPFADILYYFGCKTPFNLRLTQL